MQYFPEPNIAFHHLHKTGGTSFKQAMQAVFPACIEIDPWPHHRLPFYLEKLRARNLDAEGLPILTLIRDPLDHIVSIYWYWRQAGDPTVPDVQLSKRLGFVDFAIEFLSRARDGNALKASLVVDGKMPANLFVIRLEHWQVDLERNGFAWAGRLKMPRLNASEHGSAAEYHSPETVKLVQTRYAWMYDAGYYSRAN